MRTVAMRRIVAAAVVGGGMSFGLVACDSASQSGDGRYSQDDLNQRDLYPPPGSQNRLNTYAPPSGAYTEGAYGLGGPGAPADSGANGTPAGNNMAGTPTMQGTPSPAGGYGYGPPVGGRVPLSGGAGTSASGPGTPGAAPSTGGGNSGDRNAGALR